MLVFVENTAEAIASSSVEAGDLVRVGDLRGQRVRQTCVRDGRARLAGARPSPLWFLGALSPFLIGGQLQRGVQRAQRLLNRSVAEAVCELGNGSRVTAQDTVPFAVWAAATFLDDYPAAVTACVEAGDDVDTTAAIVGGIVAYTGTGERPGVRSVPPSNGEPLPAWADRVTGGQTWA